MAVLGIDVSKAKCQCALRLDDGRVRQKSCPNTPAGFAELGAWLTKQGVAVVHAGLEATGTYGDAVAVWLHDAGHVVSVLNPAAVHAYANSRLSRTKTDRVDAVVIADFVARQQPPPWVPPAREIRELQSLVRRLAVLQEMRTQEGNRLEAGVANAVVQRSIETMLATLETQITAVQQQIRDHIDRHPGLRQQRDLLVTIPGIADATAAVLIAELFDKRYTSARQAAAFAGVVPRLQESGTWRGRSRMSKLGPGRLRKALYYPALTALRWNPSIRPLRARLRAAGKPPMVIVGAAMRKLVHLAFGVLKSGRAYESTYAQP
jgi:transposase